MKTLITFKSRHVQNTLQRFAMALLLIIIFLPAKAQLLYGLKETKLVSFDASNPSVILSTVNISGITSGQKIEGMDFRPLTGQLYAFGYNKATMEYQIYTIDLNSGMASAVNSVPGMLDLGAVSQAQYLQIGFNFNPTVDRIRVTSTTRFNYRLNPNDGSISATDGKLNFAVGDKNEGEKPYIATVAYTNSFAGATSTELYDLDVVRALLCEQNPPNDGVLISIGKTGLAFNRMDPTIDMDIHFDIPSLTNKAYLAANLTGSIKDNLYHINLETGSATLIGPIGVDAGITDIAAFIDRTLPQVTGTIIYALGINNSLLTFDSDMPNIIRTQVTITGFVSTQSLVGMDFRPATCELFVLGYDTATNGAQLYIVNETTGVATAVNSVPLTLMLGGRTLIGMDFNPTVDRIRVVSVNNANYRLNPIDGSIAGIDSALNYDSTDGNFGMDPAVNTIAYTNSFAGSILTELYDYDFLLNNLLEQDPPNEGDLFTIGSSGISVNPADPTCDLEIYYDGSMNTAYFAANKGTSVNDKLYLIDLATGKASPLGRISYGSSIKNIATMSCGMMRVSEEQIDEELVSIYPNPTTNYISMGLPLNAASLKIMDISGRETGIQWSADSEKQAVVELSLNDLASGIYFLTVEVSGKIITQKIIKE